MSSVTGSMPSQAAMIALGNDVTVSLACSMGSLELNPFLPLIADHLLESIDVLASSCDILRRYCVLGLEANEERCRAHVMGSTVLLTALVPALGYDLASEIGKRARESGRSIREVAIEDGHVSAARFDELISPEAVMQLGAPPPKKRGERRRGII